MSPFLALWLDIGAWFLAVLRVEGDPAVLGAETGLAVFGFFVWLARGERG